MKKASFLKRTLSVLMVMCMVINTAIAFTILTVSAEDAAAYPVVIENAGNMQATKYSNYNLSPASYVLGDNAPVTEVFGVKSNAAGVTDVKNGGMRGTTEGVFEIAEANSVIAVDYYVMARGIDSPVYYPNIQSTKADKNTAGNVSYRKDGSTSDSLNKISLISGVWEKKTDYYTITSATTGTATDNGNSFLRLHFLGGLSGQETYVGDVKIYNFGADYTFGDKAGIAAAKAYIAYINREKNVNMLSGQYDISSWTMRNASYFGAFNAEIIDVEGQSFDKAARFWGNYEAMKADGGTYLGQLLPEYLVGADSLQKDEKIFVSFKARAFNYDDAACKVKPVIRPVKAGNGTLYTDVMWGSEITLTPHWEYYYQILTVKNNIEDISGAVSYRVELELGNLGQVTDIAEFKMYRCEGVATQTDAEIKAELTEKSSENLFTGTIANIGNNSANGSTVTNESISDFSLPFTIAKRFVSVSASHATWLVPNYNSIDASNTNQNDMLVLSFWAKGWKGDSTSVTGDDVTIQPRLLKLQASNTDIAEPIDSSGNKIGTLTLTPEWKRYAVVFKVPDISGVEYDHANGKGIGARIYLNTRSTAENRILYFADVKIYNLGELTAAQAHEKISETELDGVYFQARPAEKTSETAYMGYAKTGTDALAASDIYAKAINPMTEAVVKSVSESGAVVTAVAPDGTSKDYAVSVTELDELERLSVNYAVGGQKVVLRCDDLTPDVLDKFEAVLNLAKERSMKVSFGLIADEWAGATDEQWAKIKSWQDNDGVEFWHHGYTSETDPYNGAYGSIKGECGVGVPMEAQLEKFTAAYDLFAGKGIKITAFAAPFNSTSLETYKMLEQFNSTHSSAPIEAICFPTTAYYGFGIKTISSRVDLESRANTQASSATGMPQHSVFESNVEKVTDGNDFVVQVHPNAFEEQDENTGLNDFEEYEKMLDYLMNNGYTTVTMSELANPTPLKELTAGNMDAIVKLTAGKTGVKPTVIHALYSNEHELMEVSMNEISLVPFKENVVYAGLSIPESHEGFYSRLFIWDMENNLKPMCSFDELK